MHWNKQGNQWLAGNRADRTIVLFSVNPPSQSHNLLQTLTERQIVCAQMKRISALFMRGSRGARLRACPSSRN